MNRVAIFERAFERAAQAWCTSSTRNIPMNVKLCEAFADILISSFAESAQEPVAEVTIEGVIGVKFFENCNYGCGLKVGDKLYLHPTLAAQESKKKAYDAALDQAAELIEKFGDTADDSDFRFEILADRVRELKSMQEGKE